MNENTFIIGPKVDEKPENVVESVLEQIKIATKGYLEGIIQQYDGPIASYNQKSKLGIALSVAALSSENYDVQNDLGVLDEKEKHFEVLLKARKLEHYSYRLMFMGYGATSYPVKLVVDETLVRNGFGAYNPSFEFEGAAELEKFLNELINSDYFIMALQKLIDESIRYENLMKGDEI